MHTFPKVFSKTIVSDSHFRRRGLFYFQPPAVLAASSNTKVNGHITKIQTLFGSNMTSALMIGSSNSFIPKFIGV